MNQHTNHELLSMFVDGELDHEQSNQLLQSTLENEDDCIHLKELLQIRSLFGYWRKIEPTRETERMIPAPSSSLSPESHFKVGALKQSSSLPGNEWGRVMIAAALGGVLVFGGMLATQFGKKNVSPIIVHENRNSHNDGFIPRSISQLDVKQISQVFAFQESVAGPLSWYGADENSIQLKVASKENAKGPPLAILLHWKGDKFVKSYMIVCRNRVSMDVTLPHFFPNQKGLTIHLEPAWEQDQIDLQYSLIAEPESANSGPSAILVGERGIGLKVVRLGQLVLDQNLLSVEASAWRLEDADAI